MATFQSPIKSTAPIKMMFLGHTGAGKTGATMSLAAAGYKIRHLSWDGIPEIMSDYIHNPKSIYRLPRPGLWTKELADTLPNRVNFEVVTEGRNLVGGKAIPKGDSWQKAQLFLNNWIDSETKERFGNISTWGSDTVLVLDSYSRMCEAAMNFRLAIAGHLTKGPQIGNYEDNDYSAMYKNMFDFLDFLKCDEIKCHIILICHIDFLDVSTEAQGGKPNSATKEIRGFPQTIGSGRKLGPKIGQYFNHALRAKQTGTHPMIKREIVTNTDEYIELKTTAPLKVKQSYPLETGLAEYFAAIRGPFQGGEK